jgi:N6-L-threonylcarbamoyladenine synthase
MVYVLNKQGKPLMPTDRHGAVRLLLKSGRARVVRRSPFTIQLLYDTPDAVQPVALGVDAGSRHVGLSATTENRELYSAEGALRTDVVDLLATRREFRRARRNRTTRYRAPRFDNRTRPEGWLAPSLRQKIHSHIRMIEDVRKILPISRIVVETAQFDLQKIKNPEIQGEEYQHGEQLGFWNVREYVLWRDGHQCRQCFGKSRDKVLNVHHIESRKTGGDAPNNLITLCETCHTGYHQGKIRLTAKRGASFRDAACMGIMRRALYRELRGPDVHQTYGYLTKNTRIRHGLEKSHRVDARCISGNPDALPVREWYMLQAVRRHNRQIHKATISQGGIRKRNQAPKYVRGFQLFDKVLFRGRECFVFGRRASGYFDVRTLSGEKLSAGVSYKKLRRLESRSTLLTERRSD